MKDVKSYQYVLNYFEDVSTLVEAIHKYTKLAKIPNGEYTLLDLLR